MLKKKFILVFVFLFFDLFFFSMHSNAISIYDFFREQFKITDIIFIGEIHTVAEHKVFLDGLLENLMMDGTIDGFAFEFTEANHQSIFNNYLLDPNATMGSEKEMDYLIQLNWNYSNMFNVKEYDSIMRRMKQIWNIKGGSLVFCAIDERSIHLDQNNNGPKYNALKALPQKVQSEIEKKSGKSIEQIAKENYAFDREAKIGVNIANCAIRSKKTLVYVGGGHALKMDDTPNNTWQTALGFTKIMLPSKSVSTALLAQGFYDPYVSDLFLPMFSQQCFHSLQLHNVDDFVPFFSNSIPSKFYPCLDSTNDTSQSYSLRSFFDYIIIGPRGTKVKPSPLREWM